MQIKVPLGKTDLNVNPIGFGGIPIQRLSLEESDKVVGKALDMGINFFDTSRVYTDSEEKLGRIFSNYPRDGIIIASKTFSRDARNAAADLETGLKLMKTDYIDLYQCHNISTEDQINQILAPGGALEALKKAQQDGKIRYIGITGHKPPVLAEALKVFDFDTLQIPMNYIETSALSELVPFAREKDMGIIAMKPVAGGAFKNVPLALRFSLIHGADVVIPGMDSVQQVVENISTLANLKPLNKKELAVLEKEKAGLDENFCRRCEYCMPCPEGLPISFLHVLRAYYFRYNLQDWAMSRVKDLPKSYKDCTGCRQCVEKCPYALDNPKIFRETWDQMNT
jgi:predicted aldo/keto reductase-like oxidoreductase